MGERLQHPEEGMVFACPDCDDPGPYLWEDGSRCSCHGCGSQFDRSRLETRESREDPLEAAKSARVGPESEIGQALLEADPSDLGGSV